MEPVLAEVKFVIGRLLLRPRQTLHFLVSGVVAIIPTKIDSLNDND